ncbi:hypothetical protein E8E14_004039 [Neopestalotiopsis sp. 37M]|nr:hypothetical protein E8E14_004039 [Neopestalotiopsis sp. 37M]
MVETAREVGVDEAIRLKNAGRQNRTMLIDCVKKLGVAEKVDLHLHGTVVVFETEEEKGAYDRDVIFASEHGYNPEGYYLSPEETAKKFTLEPALCAYGAAFIENSGTIYPRKFVHELLKSAMSKMPQLSIHPYTPVESISHLPSTSTYQVCTAQGVVNTKAIFHATNAYAGSISPSLGGPDGVFGCKAHMLGVQPNVPGCTRQLKPGFGYANFWHWILQRPDSGPYLYGLANAELLNDYDDTKTLPLDSAVRKDMVEFLQKAFPESFQSIDSSRDIKYDWTGIQGFTMTGASIVGRVSADSPGEFVSVGHNGEGMGRCFLAATVATDAMLAYLSGEAYVVPESFPKSWRRNM